MSRRDDSVRLRHILDAARKFLRHLDHHHRHGASSTEESRQPSDGTALCPVLNFPLAQRIPAACSGSDPHPCVPPAEIGRAERHGLRFLRSHFDGEAELLGSVLGRRLPAQSQGAQ
jgi:hypothetical protein